MPFIYPLADINLSGKVLVVPIVSTANVAQLTVDLIISTFALTRIANLDPSFCIPVVGGREDGLSGITTTLELFGKIGLNVVVIQQRSPILSSRKQDYVGALFNFIKASSFSAVLFLSGVDLSNREDSQMFTPVFQLRVPAGPPLEGTPLEFLQQKVIPNYNEDTNETTDVPFIPGGGITRRIVSSLPKDWATPTGSLLQFVIEGDNRADASLLASVVVKILGLDSQISQWKPPSSWAFGLFGSPHDQDLYG